MAKSVHIAGAAPTPAEIEELRRELAAMRVRERELGLELAAIQQRNTEAIAEANERADKAEALLPELELQAATGELALRLGVPVDSLGDDVGLAEIVELIAQRKRAAAETAGTAETLRARHDLRSGPPITGKPPTPSDAMNNLIRENGRGGY
jgi:hypothetical protein